VLEGIKVTGPSTIEADWVSAGWLKKELFPWHPKVPPFKGQLNFVTPRIPFLLLYLSVY
jgi:hypothetical protein